MNEEIKNEIQKLKKEKDAVILAHYYVDGEVQEIADYVGDSYYLAEIATKVPESTIVFCGVSFMGESAKILNPKKRVVMADGHADCPIPVLIQIPYDPAMHHRHFIHSGLSHMCRQIP